MKKLIIISTVVLVLALLLTLAPACGKGEEKTPTPGFTPTPGVTPTPTPKAETLKIGLILPLSGPMAGYGVPYEAGVKWAADRINEAGGFKVGADIYKIKVVSCDDMFTPSKCGECAARLVYDEGVKYNVGPIGGPLAMVVMDLLNDNKIITSDVASWVPLLGPDYPYHILGFPLGFDGEWVRGFVGKVLEYHPEIKTIGIIGMEPWKDLWMVGEREAAEAYGLTVVAEATYVPGTTDFYPTLIKVLAKRPDVITMTNCGPGDLALMIKQARELGYRGILYAPGAVPLDILFATAGKEAAEGFLNNLPDYTNPLWPEATRALHQDYMNRYPNLEMYTTTMSGYVSVNLYVKAIQLAGTTDTDAVVAVFDDPDFTFDFMGAEVKFGGREFYGAARVFPFPQAFSVIKNGELEQLELFWVEVP